MPPPEVLATVADPDGRPVVLTAARWRHVLDGHPELAPHQDLVLAAIRAPDRRLPGRWPNERWCYLATPAGPSRWLKVVVVYEGERGQVFTAFARRAFP
jgi:hypothetical protein